MKKEEKELFNVEVFNILKCAQPDGFGYIDSELPLKLMKLGYLKDNPRDNWSNNGYKASLKGISLYKCFLKELQKKHGHIWQTDDEGNIDIFAYSTGNHNGLRCSICDYGFCQHCSSEFDIVKCSSSLKEKQRKIKKLKKEIESIQSTI